MLENAVAKVNEVLWSTPMVVLILLIGLYLSIRMLVPQLRLIVDMVRHLIGGGGSEAGLTSFQAFAMALGGRIGVGNIAGVATAIAAGGPGALFWMWVTAFLGAPVAMAESSLAQLWKEKVGGEFRGGPAYYITKGLGWRWLAFLYAVATIFATTFTGPQIQSNAIALSGETAFSVPTWVSGVVVAVLFCLVVFGGMRRLGRVVGLVVPFMAIGYILLGLVMAVMLWREVPAMFALIFRSALDMEAAFGGMFGAAVMWGVRRAVYSSEVGTGSAAQASAAAEVSHPVKQGLAQGFSAYIDTLFVCTVTGLMILSTNSYNVVDPDGKTRVEHLPGVEAGPAYTQTAIDSVLPGFGSGFVAVAMFFFAFTTLLSFSFYAETNINWLLHGKRAEKPLVWLARLVLAGSIVYGAVQTSAMAWSLADLGVGLYTWVNLVALVALSPVAIRLVRDYDRQRRAGLDPIFDPADIGITNAEVWGEVARHHERERAEGAPGAGEELADGRG